MTNAIKRRSAAATLGACAVTLAVALTGCSSATKTATESSPSAASATQATTATSGLAVPDRPSGPNMTIADYVDQNKIVETAVKQGDADSPTFDFPMPPDWKAAGPRKPEWAYGAIIYDKAEDPADPPFMTAIVSKLTGNVDPAKVLEYAPGLLQNLPGYEQDGEIQKSTLSGFEAIQFQASYLAGEVRRYIAQKTVVIPAKDGGIFVLQINADAPLGQDQVVLDAAKVINEKTTITV
ncbi:MAG: LpqN/LpqT family lipoprotein [Mycobacterium sp.]